MKKIITFISIVSCFLFIAQEYSFAQVTTTHYTGNIATLIQQYFISDESVELDLSYGHEPKFNGATTSTSTQLGTFTNANTSGNNMPISSGIVITTGSYEQTGVGSGPYDGTQSGPGYCQDCGANSPALYQTYQSQGGTRQMNDVACLSFWVIPKSDALSFSYCFASEEYPNYVCSDYNDIFGFFISGPYDDNGNLVTTVGDVYNNQNIALIPNTTTPVMINSVNGGVLGSSGGSLSNPGCDLGNSQYFITNDNYNCRMNGYTTELPTQKIEVAPCYKYRIELAIANIGDQAYNSAVYLKANSLHADKLNLDVAGNDVNGVYTKGCGRAKVSVTANYELSNTIQYTVQISPSEGSSINLGEDYALVDENNQTIGSTLTLSRGQSEAYFYIDFLHNENKAAGTSDTLYLITEYVNECTPRDTIKIILQEPQEIVYNVEGGKTYCDNELPVTENIVVTTQGAHKYMKVTITNSLNQEPFETIVRQEATSTDNTLTATYNPVITDPVEFYIAVEDSCGRTYFDTVKYEIQGANTSASISNDYICEGEQVVLSCPEAVKYTWTAEPTDASLLGQESIREPQVTPAENTTYTITIEDENGCIATANVDISVIANVKARISLSAHTLTLSNATLIYEDVTVNGADRFWDLGDGTTSTAISGTENYPVTDSGTYNIMLIAYNAAGCADTAYDQIRVVPDFTFYLPNAFIPGESEPSLGIFAPQGSMSEYYTLDVYNRWGAKIFSGKQNEGWDGTLENGEWAPQGTYIFDILYLNGEGLLQRKTGTFTALPKSQSK